MSVVAVLGASPKEDRYSNKAVKALLEHGHTVIPVTPKGGVIHGVDVLKTIAEIDEPVDTLTLYVNPKVLRATLPDILALNPKRVIFNPGTECDECEGKLDAAGIETLRACTLVMLQTDQF